MRYVLVLQWDLQGNDYGALIETEGALVGSLEPDHSVDGHDLGSDEMNIFIVTSDPVAAFEEARVALSATRARGDYRAGYRELDHDDFVSLWPPGLTRFDVI